MLYADGWWTLNTNAFPDLFRILCYSTCTYLHFSAASSSCLFCFDGMDRNDNVFGISFGTKYLNRNCEQETLLSAITSNWVQNLELTKKFSAPFQIHWPFWFFTNIFNVQNSNFTRTWIAESILQSMIMN